MKWPGGEERGSEKVQSEKKDKLLNFCCWLKMKKKFEHWEWKHKSDGREHKESKWERDVMRIEEKYFIKISKYLFSESEDVWTMLSVQCPTIEWTKTLTWIVVMFGQKKKFENCDKVFWDLVGNIFLAPKTRNKTKQKIVCQRINLLWVLPFGLRTEDRIIWKWNFGTEREK